MKKSVSVSSIIMLVLGVLFLALGGYAIANRFMEVPIWTVNHEYLTNNFIYSSVGICCLIVGLLLFFFAIIRISKQSAEAKGAESTRHHMGMRASNAISNTAIHILLVIISVIWLIPFVCIVLQSFRVDPLCQVGYVIPKHWGFDNYVNLFVNKDEAGNVISSTLSTNGFLRWYLNTLIIALSCAVMQTIIQLCMSYTLSRFRFKMRKGLMQFMLILGMFPGMLSMIILYNVLKDLGLTSEHAVPGLILVYIASSGMGYYVSKGFFDTLPKSLDEAARIDGATRAQVLWKIILPLAKPIVIYTVLTGFMAPWGDYVFAQYISRSAPQGMNVAVGLYNWLSNDQINQCYTKFCAGGVVVAIPVAILFMCLQRYYVEGVTGGAVKG